MFFLHSVNSSFLHVLHLFDRKEPKLPEELCGLSPTLSCLPLLGETFHVYVWSFTRSTDKKRNICTHVLEKCIDQNCLPHTHTHTHMLMKYRKKHPLIFSPSLLSQWALTPASTRGFFSAALASSLDDTEMCLLCSYKGMYESEAWCWGKTLERFCNTDKGEWGELTNHFLLASNSCEWFNHFSGCKN